MFGNEAHGSFLCVLRDGGVGVRRGGAYMKQHLICLTLVLRNLLVAFACEGVQGTALEVMFSAIL